MIHLCNVLIWHDDQEALAGIFIGLQLIVLRVYARPIAEQKQEFGGEVWVVAGFRDVDLKSESA